MDTSRKIKIFDTTLRDGQQCPGAGMSFAENIRYAELSCEVGIDVLEAGFPSASKLDFEIVMTIARDIASRDNSPVVAGLCQLREEQIVRTIESLLPAVPHKKARLHTYLPVAPDLLKASLGSKAADKKGIVLDLFNFVKMAVAEGLEVEFSPEGYSRQGDNFSFTTDLIRAAVEAGASVINCPDTIGGGCRFEGADYFVNRMRQHAEIIDKEFPDNNVTWSTHCHNDFGLALDNSLEAVFSGPARQIEGCFGGVGERAGNVALEQCVMVIAHFAKCLDADTPFYTGIQTKEMYRILQFISGNMLPAQPHSPIGGDNAMRHSSGGHTNAILKNPRVYQPFDPAEVGREIALVFGPLSGGNHAKSIVEKNGYRCTEAEKAGLAQFIKTYYAERRKGITDKELMKAYFDYRKPIDIKGVDYAKSASRSEVTLSGRFFDQEGEVYGSNEGRDSALVALKKMIDEKFPGLSLTSHKSRSVGESVHALSVSTIEVEYQGMVFRGAGEDSDIELSAIRALIDATNRAYVDSKFKNKTRVQEVL